MAKYISVKDKEIGERIRACREGRGFSREELASIVYNLPENGGMNRSPGQIGYLERGERPLSQIWATLLSKALNVRREYLLCIDDSPTLYDKQFSDAHYPFEKKNSDLICNLEALTHYASKLGYEFEPRITYLKSDEVISLQKKIPDFDLLTFEIEAHEDVKRQIYFAGTEFRAELEFNGLFENDKEYSFGKYNERSKFKLIESVNNSTIATFTGLEIISLAQEIGDFAEFKIMKDIKGIQSHENK